MGHAGLAFCAWGVKNPDPWLAILRRRAKRARAMFHMSEQWRAHMTAVLVEHIVRGTPGTCSEVEEPQWVAPGLVGEVPWQ
eukprot:6342966-Alexandrium_andersonii.AAC.1